MKSSKIFNFPKQFRPCPTIFADICFFQGFCKLNFKKEPAFKFCEILHTQYTYQGGKSATDLDKFGWKVFIFSEILERFFKDFIKKTLPEAQRTQGIESIT